jgi:hypothetical protein
MRRRFVQFLPCVFLIVSLASLAFVDETNLTLTIDGTLYTNVTWGTVTPATITMFHKSGVSVVPIEKLPDEWQKHFCYDPQKAAAYRAEVAKAQAHTAKRMDRDATAQAIDRVADPNSRIDGEAAANDVDAVRTRYKQLIDLQKSGHTDYRPAIDMLVEACRRAIDYHYELRKERAEYRDASQKFESFRGGPDVPANIVIRRDLFAKKIAADAYYQGCARLLDEAKKAWSEGLNQKTLVDSKLHPVPPPPPKPAVTDPYLQEAP